MGESCRQGITNDSTEAMVEGFHPSTRNRHWVELSGELLLDNLSSMGELRLVDPVGPDVGYSK